VNPEAWRVLPHGLALQVRLTPRGGRDALEGLSELADGRSVLKARVRAVPEDGAANRALLALIAKALGVAKSDVTLTGGHTARLKDVEIAGNGAALAERLAALTKG
jgi:uncharacterized protein YggU (UPF0235/DUF167 family)